MSLEFSRKYAKELKKDPNFRPKRWQDENNEPSLTRQEFTKETDINRIVDKFTRTGRMPYDPDRLGIYIDASELPDFKSQLEFVTHAKESFNNLDPQIRKRFENSPQKLLDFLKDPSNKEEGQRLGLFKPDPVVEPAPEPVDPEPAPAE